MTKPSRFYHFTDRRHLKKIMTKGLTPTVEKHCERPPVFEPVVWLTTGTVDMFFCGEPEVRITVNLSPNSKRLHHWPTWLKKHAPDYLAELYFWQEQDGDVSWQDYWFFTGTITPDKFTAIEVDLAEEVRYAAGATTKRARNLG
jgi:hypothetical protein